MIQKGGVGRALGGMKSLGRRYRHVEQAGAWTIMHQSIVGSELLDLADRTYNEGRQFDAVVFELPDWEAKIDVVRSGR